MSALYLFCARIQKGRSLNKSAVTGAGVLGISKGPPI